MILAFLNVQRLCGELSGTEPDQGYVGMDSIYRDEAKGKDPRQGNDNPWSHLELQFGLQSSKHFTIRLLRRSIINLVARAGFIGRRELPSGQGISGARC